MGLIWAHGNRLTLSVHLKALRGGVMSLRNGGIDSEVNQQKVTIYNNYKNVLAAFAHDLELCSLRPFLTFWITFFEDNHASLL